MIGNDVVDLKLAKKRSNWKRKGFLDKIFTESERQMIKKSNDSFTTVWLLWSMKESAYKIYNRQNKIRFFAPKKFECNINDLQSTVTFCDKKYYTTSIINDASIYTVATSILNLYKKKLVTSSFELSSDTYKAQHNTTYQQLKLSFSKEFTIPFDEISIEKNENGVPHIKYLNRDLKKVKNATMSISHHGKYGAYAFVK